MVNKEGPVCRFCGCLIGEGFKHGKLYLCIDCWELLGAIIRDALPEAMRQVMDKASIGWFRSLDASRRQ